MAEALCSNDDPFCHESAWCWTEREAGVNPRACFLPKANGAVQHLIDPNRSHTTKTWVHGRAPKNMLVLHRVPRQMSKEQPYPTSTTLWMQAPVGRIMDIQNPFWIGAARLPGFQRTHWHGIEWFWKIHDNRSDASSLNTKSTAMG